MQKCECSREYADIRMFAREEVTDPGAVSNRDLS